MSRKKKIFSTLFLMSISLLFVGKTFYATAAEKDNRICAGVYIDAVDVSGMTKEEAIAAVDSFIESLRSKVVTIRVGDNSVSTTMGNLGYTYEANDNIDQAMALGQSGNLIKRYKDLKDIEHGNIVYPLNFTYDESRVKEFVEAEAGKYNIAPINAKVSRNYGKFVYTDHVVGSKVDVKNTSGIISNVITNDWDRSDILVDAVMVDDMPKYTRADVEKCNAILGTFTTEYADSAEGRAANLANGAKLINNAIVYPGEVFSSYDYLTPFTGENGYYTAHAYQQGKVIDSVGGGACQVTTTLYNAILDSELEVVERQAHSMTISYVDLSRDAAIAGTYKDFKFKNNSDTPVLVEAHTQGRRITFTIWGQETRNSANRKVEYVTVKLSETPPPADVITKDPNQPTTYRKVTQSAHTGYRTELYKVVYENGVEISRTLVNKSSYAAAPRYITIGTKVVKEDEEKKDKDKGKDKNKGNADVDPSQDESGGEIESQSSINITNPKEQLQGDIYWDSSWDNEDFED